MNFCDKDKGTRKVGGAGKRKRKGERACNHFIYDPLAHTCCTFEIIRFRLSNCWNVNDKGTFDLCRLLAVIRKQLTCENIRFSSLFVDGDVSRETSPAAKSEETRMFSQASGTFGIIRFRLQTVEMSMSWNLSQISREIISRGAIRLWTGPLFRDGVKKSQGEGRKKPFPSLSSRFFHPFPKQRACSQATNPLSGTPNETIVQNRLNKAFLNVF